MIAKGALLASTLLLVAATTADWQWRLPDRIDPPPVPVDNPMSAAKVALGRRLFHDADLSIDGTMACATCHEQRHGFADGNRTRAGVHGDPGRRNVPGLANVAWITPLTFGDGRVATLEHQAAIPLFGDQPVEMGMAGAEAEIAKRLGGDACYRAMFAAAFPDRGERIDPTTVMMALAAFQRTLISFGSPADTGRLSALARQGRQAFQRECATCHSGPALTDRRAVIAYLEALTDPAFLSDPSFAYPDAPCAGSSRNAAASETSEGVSATAVSIATSSAR